MKIVHKPAEPEIHELICDRCQRILLEIYV
jgi:hypothetical protein